MIVVKSDPSRALKQALLQMADCGNCPLAKDGSAVDPVAGCGNSKAFFVVVGEAPGIVERDKGKPFVGPSGKLLWDALVSRQLRDSMVYTTNALMCQPPDGKTPNAKMLRACNNRLDHEIRALKQRRVILCVGAKAAEAVRGEPSAISALNGRVEWSERFGCWVVYAWHPAAVLRNPDLYPDFEWAVRLAVKAVKRPLKAPATTVERPIEWWVPETAEICEQTFHELVTYPPEKVACDIETTGLNEFGDRILEVGFCWDGQTAMLVPVELFTDSGVRKEAQRLFASHDSKWIYHNGKFDTRFLAHHLGVDARVDRDTMLLHYALDERGGDALGFHDLKHLSHRYCGAPAYNENVDRAHMEDVAPEVRRPYHAADCVYTYRLDTVLLELHAEEPPSREGWPAPIECHNNIMIPALHAIRSVERRGIRIDLDRLQELQKSYTEQIIEAKDKCAELIGKDVGAFNPGSTQQVQKALAELGYPAMGSSNEATLHELQRWEQRAGRPRHPFLDAVLDYRSLKHTKSTYLDGIQLRVNRAPRDGRLRGSFTQHVTVTGRLSARDPNLQNVPKDSVIREIFVPSEGRVLADFDYQRLEVGVLAWYSGDPALTRDFLSADFHWNTAQRIFPQATRRMDDALACGDLAELEAVCKLQLSLNDFWVRQQRPGERTTDPKVLYGWMKTRLRRQAKYVSFGMMFGEGANSLSSEEKGLGVPKAEADAYLKSWKAAYSVAMGFMDDSIKHARKERWVESASGRRRRFQYPRDMSSHLANEAMNQPVQAFASDICLGALTRLELERLSPTGRGAVLLTIHDSILTEIDEDWLDDGVALVKDVMESMIVEPDIRFSVDVGVGKTWATCK